MPIENADYHIFVMHFPAPVPACCHLNDDGTYCIYLNADYDFSHWMDSYEHELWHIIRDDFYGGKDIADLEFH